MRKEIKKMSMILMLGLLLCGNMTASAAERPVVYNSDAEGNELSIIVGNLKDVQSVSCQIGNVKCEEAAVEDTVMLETYILMDNSLSIDSKYHDTIRQILLTLIGTISEQEKVTVATFDRELHYLVQDSSDIEQLKQAVEGVSYENLDTKVTDVMYSLCKDLENTPFAGLRRIILISDGAEYSSVGYTRQEMLNELQKLSYPVYTVGCTYKDNTKDLEEMFSISRVTGAESVWLDEETDAQKITDLINSCRNAVRVKVTIPDKLGDGTSKGVKLDFQTAEGEESVSAAVVMPFIEIAETKTEEKTEGVEDETVLAGEPTEVPTEQVTEGISGEEQEETPWENPKEESGETLWGTSTMETQWETRAEEPEETQEETWTEESRGEAISETIKETEEPQSTSQMKSVSDTEDTEESDSETPTEREPETEAGATGKEAFPVTPVAAVLLVILVVFLIMRKRKSGKKGEDDSRFNGTVGMDEDTTDFDDEPTMMSEEEEATAFEEEPTMMTEDERTMMLDEDATSTSEESGAMDFISIRFTDMRNPARMFEVPLSARINIGRSVQKNQVVFDYERSVSSQHCEIVRRGEEIYIRDLNSTNGTWVDGAMVEDEMEIYSGAILKLGRLEVKFEIV